MIIASILTPLFVIIALIYVMLTVTRYLGKGGGNETIYTEGDAELFSAEVEQKDERAPRPIGTKFTKLKQPAKPKVALHSEDDRDSVEGGKHKKLLTKEELKRAVIYSEILKPKF